MSIIFVNPYSFYDTDAQAYITAVEAADGQGLEDGVKNAINSFVIGCKADGIWSAIKASCILAGARTLAGALVPLVGTAPTNVGTFASGDYDRETGLVSNGSTKYLNSNRKDDADPQNNNHLAVYATTLQSSGVFGVYLGVRYIDLNDPTIQRNRWTGRSGASPANLVSTNEGGTTKISSGLGDGAGFIGQSRSQSADYSVRAENQTDTFAVGSVTPVNNNIHVFRRNASDGSNAPTDARLAFYSIGESLDLALLDARVTNLINAYAAAIP